MQQHVLGVRAVAGLGVGNFHPVHSDASVGDGHEVVRHLKLLAIAAEEPPSSVAVWWGFSVRDVCRAAAPRIVFLLG